MPVLTHYHPAGAERAHVQPQRRRSGSPVVKEHQRPRSAAALFEIGGVEHRAFGRQPGLVSVRRRCRRLFAPGDVVPAGSVHHQRARHGLIGNLLAADSDRAGAGDFARLEDPVGPAGLGCGDGFLGRFRRPCGSGQQGRSRS